METHPSAQFIRSGFGEMARVCAQFRTILRTRRPHVARLAAERFGLPHRLERTFTRLTAQIDQLEAEIALGKARLDGRGTRATGVHAAEEARRVIEGILGDPAPAIREPAKVSKGKRKPAVIPEWSDGVAAGM
ncbi:MAG: hypothetical protein HY660_13520 [Armatimonadetes bacterium]|nr:hypothetical protein [Armatimonadota bacterium]